MLTTNENGCNPQFQPMNAFVVPLVVNRGSPTQHREAGPLNGFRTVNNSVVHAEINLLQFEGVYPNSSGEGIGRGHLFAFKCLNEFL